ncbi:hypothetical protein HAX54_001966 [Datura stramonium]|uniref:Uncharacterized protein n=1 Tax=Datura stramonium TaxID=4076 RepID=A0ABS8T4C0_DATST|nr:hypothetical protein [Datura stramonium]
MEREKRKRLSQDKLFALIWKGIKKIMKTLSPGSKMPQHTCYDGLFLAVVNLRQRDPSNCNGNSLSSMQFPDY